MKQAFLPFLTSLALAAGSGAVVAADAGLKQADVAAQDLLKVRESGRVSTALWTRRTDSYTLQLVYGGAVRTTGTRIAPLPAKLPTYQVWLIRANGTQILPTYRSPEPDPAKCTLRCIAQEVLYRFPLADGDEAVAAVVRVDDDYYLEKLQPLKPAL